MERRFDDEREPRNDKPSQAEPYWYDSRNRICNRSAALERGKQRVPQALPQVIRADQRTYRRSRSTLPSPTLSVPSRRTLYWRT